MEKAILAPHREWFSSVSDLHPPPSPPAILLLPTFPFLSPLLLTPVLTRPLSGAALGPPRALADKKDPRHQDGGTWFLLMRAEGSLTQPSSNTSAAPPWGPETPSLTLHPGIIFRRFQLKHKYSAWEW